MTLADDAINIHRILRGKIEICNKISLDHSETGNIERSKKTTLDMVYTPGVAFVAEQISKDKSLAYDFTSKWNNIAIVCDGTRVLGLGNIGPEGALAVMEGKSILYKILGNINAYPLCIDLKDKDDIIKFVKAIHPMFSAINIEDIESPKVLDIVDELQNELPLPIFHDDQHGTAIITLAALLNALKLVKKEISNAKVVIAGAGSAGYGIFKILKQTGAKDIVVADSLGAIFKERDQGIDNKYKREIADNTNLQNLHGDFKALLENADVFIGVSGKENLLNKATIKSMNRDPIIFALSNPDPEILPSDAIEGGGRIIATGRSDYANQINNAVVFPSFLRALLDLRINAISEEMLVLVAFAIAGLVDSRHLKDDYIIPSIDDPRIIAIVTSTLKTAIHNGLEPESQQQ